MPESGYFAALSKALVSAGLWQPTLVIDRNRLDRNLQKVRERVPAHLDLRIVDKSLASVPLLQYIAKVLNSNKIMSFHLPVTLAVLEAMPETDVLFGKPMPVGALHQLLASQPPERSQRLFANTTWLIDTPQRLQQYHGLAQASQCELKFVFEVNVGLHRGGFTSVSELAAAVNLLPQLPLLKCQGLMGYDAQVAEVPSIFGGPRQELENSNLKLKAFVECLPKESRKLINTGGSKTILSYQDNTTATEISVGSAFLQPTDFDLPSLTELKPAAFIATPVLKVLDAALPGPFWVTKLLQAIKVFPRKRSFIYGGKWMADPVWPPGMCRNSLWGESSNQQFMALPNQTNLRADDLVFFRPTQSEAILQYFGDLAVYDGEKIDQYWPVLPPA
jgi:D-serine deaminase-like pyridoxal phosphate-dependent protein